MKTTSYLFIYGTLMDKHNEYGAYLQQNCTFYADGKVKGRLYDLGEYPGAVLDNTINTYIYGKVFLVNKIDEVLVRLDEYEGFGPDEEQPNLFVRALVPIQITSEVLYCWMYLYNLPTGEFTKIESGKYQPDILSLSKDLPPR